ncbi:LysR family transcriptional regulator [Thaumasiovibrio subtropicus]|uniref:LysR family transcriptional regulator n=1 Tax=Thaumasiovibrio subtropicus TaxID=1891207 RepID=UPI000B364AC4|nr:LysR family transcriptional regulator [Thaumasiovibrio subtropicus]
MARASIEQLTAFVAVAEQGSFSAAARKLGKDRATLHHQVTNLEIDWDLELFERAGKKPKLTTEGEPLLRQAKHILYQLDALELACDSLSQGEVAEVTVCHDVALPCDAIASFDSGMRRAFPHTRIHWLQRDRDPAIDALLRSQADFAITLNSGAITPKAGLRFHNLGYPKFGFYVHRNHTLAQRKDLSIRDLEQCRQLVAEDLMNTALKAQMVVASNAVKVSNIDVLLRMLQDDGFAILPEHVLTSSFYADQFCQLDLAFMTKEGRAGYVLLSRSELDNSPVHHALITEITAWFKALP